MKVQIAFQGGGARFVDMLPVVSVLRELEESGIIEITRVSGSSAGAICASLLAIQADIGGLRAFAKKNGEQLLLETSSHFSRETSTKVQNAVAVSQIALGWPLVKPTKFRKFIATLFAKSVEDFSDDPDFWETLNNSSQRAKLYVSVADLGKGAGEFVEDGDLVDAVVNSCAFPFAVKNYRQLRENQLIDGGLTENLPTSAFMDSNEEGQKIMVCPKDRSSASSLPRNPISFASRLFSTAINNQVVRAKMEDGDSLVIDVESEIEIHEVHKGFANLVNDDWWERRRERYRQRLSEFLDMTPKDATSSAVLTTSPTAPYFRKNLFKIYENLFSQQSYELERLVHVVRADCLNQSVRGVRSYDRVEREAVLKIGADGLACFRSFAPKYKGVQVPTIFHATLLGEEKEEDEPLSVIPIPVDTPDEAFGSPGVTMLFFEGKRPDDLAGRRLRIRSVNHHEIGVSELLEKNCDYVNFQHRHHVVAKEAAILLLYPSNFGQIDALASRKSEVEGCTVVEPQALADWRINKPSEFEMIGRVFANLEPQKKFQVDFIKRS
ncbi:patatin-like phospholipase family protein [uncultured Shimia sp.]|uniref:patatin-like phospholipase family protein n=1 Tax=uncultured Shimia sp. TaxID=573152 RepID=UPI0025F7B89D|nr:patatin-like phospholipase family protein [uncultured Shimia sp.]